MHASIEVKRIDLWSLFRLAFLLYACLGLIVGFFMVVVISTLGGIGSALAEEDIPGLGLLTGVVGLFIVPVLAFVYGAMGSVIVTIVGALFNLMSRVAGGLKLDVALAQPMFGTPAPAPRYTPPGDPMPPPPPGPPYVPPEAPPMRPPEPPADPPRFE